MTRHRRGIAILATLAVLATALWPLVTSLTAAAAGEAVPLCHQAGMQVAADSMPMPMGDEQEPATPVPARSHCPLCVLVFFAAFSPTLAAPPFTPFTLGTVEPAAPAPLQRRFAVHLPESRAPPPFVAA